MMYVQSCEALSQHSHAWPHARARLSTEKHTSSAQGLLLRTVREQAGGQAPGQQVGAQVERLQAGAGQAAGRAAQGARQGVVAQVQVGQVCRQARQSSGHATLRMPFDKLPQIGKDIAWLCRKHS